MILLDISVHVRLHAEMSLSFECCVVFGGKLRLLTALALCW